MESPKKYFELRLGKLRECVVPVSDKYPLKAGKYFCHTRNTTGPGETETRFFLDRFSSSSLALIVE
jgi:hypothetical protein